MKLCGYIYHQGTYPAILKKVPTCRVRSGGHTADSLARLIQEAFAGGKSGTTKATFRNMAEARKRGACSRTNAAAQQI